MRKDGEDDIFRHKHTKKRREGFRQLKTKRKKGPGCLNDTLIVVYLNDANTIQDIEKCIRDINTSKCMTPVIRGNATDEHLHSVRRGLDECVKGKGGEDR